MKNSASKEEKEGKSLPSLHLETMETFAKRIRRKFPGQYDGVPDNRLVREWLARYPQYRSRFADHSEGKGLPLLSE